MMAGDSSDLAALDPAKEKFDATHYIHDDFTEISSFRYITPETEAPDTIYNIRAFGQAIPWHDKTYMILEKNTGRAITLTGHGLRLEDCKDGPNDSNSWLCVCKDNYTGFYNPRARAYLGHDGSESKSNLHAKISHLDEWECFIPRPHPTGGFMLLSAFWIKQLWMVVVTAEGKVMRGKHGDTLWIFEEI